MSKPVLYADRSKPNNVMESLQSTIINRFARTQRQLEPIIFEFTQDRALLHQYYRLREIMYRKVFNTDLFVGDEDLHDKLSHILIARRGNLCLGGCRLTIREADEKWALPMESAEFKLRGIFPELQLDRHRHAEISRFAVMEDVGDQDIFYGLCKVMYDKVIDSQIHYLFAKSTNTLARNWRLIANSFGVKTTRICTEINVPENPIHPDVRWFVTMSDMTSYCSDVSRAEKTEENAASAPSLALVD